MKLFHTTFFVLIGIILTSSGYTYDNHSAPLILDMVHHNPGEQPYQSTYEDPTVIKEMGFNGKVYFLFDSPTLAINWESLDKDILPKGSVDRKWVDNKAAHIRSVHEHCRKAGITILAQNDMVLFPKRLIAKYGIEKTFGDPGHKLTKKLIRTQIDEAFTQFPLLDGFVIRIGETYLHDAPYHKGHIQHKSSAEKTIIPLIQLLREEVCVKRNKQLIFRTWLSFDKNSDTYLKVSKAVEPHKNLVFSVKHCEGDFHRANAFSKIIGMGRHRQLIEVQCAREYEGKGAYPNYIAHGVIEGFEEHQNRLGYKSIRHFVEDKPEIFAGIWTWSRGGGWNGPYPSSEMWCDLNAWVMAQWAKDPTQTEEEIFRRYAVERLKIRKEDVPNFRQLALLSADAVIRGRNSTHRDMNAWWTRDQGIGWPGVNKDSKRQQRNLKQKDESLRIWQKMVDLAEAIHWPDAKTRDFAVGSTHYGQRLYKIYHSLVYLADAHARNDIEAQIQLLEAYDHAWSRYNNLPREFKQMSTLYTKDFKRHIKQPANKIVNQVRKQLTSP